MRGPGSAVACRGVPGQQRYGPSGPPRALLPRGTTTTLLLVLLYSPRGTLHREEHYREEHYTARNTTPRGQREQNTARTKRTEHREDNDNEHREDNDNDNEHREDNDNEPREDKEYKE